MNLKICALRNVDTIAPGLDRTPNLMRLFLPVTSVAEFSLSYPTDSKPGTANLSYLSTASNVDKCWQSSAGKG